MSREDASAANIAGWILNAWIMALGALLYCGYLHDQNSKLEQRIVALESAQKEAK